MGPSKRATSAGGERENRLLLVSHYQESTHSGTRPAVRGNPGCPAGRRPARNSLLARHLPEPPPELSAKAQAL
jgi:hypothetical protein